MAKLNLQCFLYLLMRDHLTTGTVRTILKDVASLPSDEIEYSEKYLAEIAKEISELFK